MNDQGSREFSSNLVGATEKDLSECPDTILPGTLEPEKENSKTSIKIKLNSSFNNGDFQNPHFLEYQSDQSGNEGVKLQETSSNGTKRGPTFVEDNLTSRLNKNILQGRRENVTKRFSSSPRVIEDKSTNSKSKKSSSGSNHKDKKVLKKKNTPNTQTKLGKSKAGKKEKDKVTKKGQKTTSDADKTSSLGMLGERSEIIFKYLGAIVFGIIIFGAMFINIAFF